jgi:hypothetical protein
MVKNQGTKKFVVQFYHKDFMADLQEHPCEIAGAWIKILCKIWLDTEGTLIRSLTQYSILLGKSPEETRTILKYIHAEEIGDVSGGDERISVTSRRWERECKKKAGSRARQAEHRKLSLFEDDPDANKKKERHLNRVLLTKVEHKKLVEKLGQQSTDGYIFDLDDYISRTGKTNKDHYLTILHWDRRRVKKAAPVNKTNKWEGKL